MAEFRSASTILPSLFTDVALWVLALFALLPTPSAVGDFQKKLA
jgi:hypothetical protein